MLASAGWTVAEPNRIWPGTEIALINAAVLKSIEGVIGDDIMDWLNHCILAMLCFALLFSIVDVRS